MPNEKPAHNGLKHENRFGFGLVQAWEHFSDRNKDPLFDQLTHRNYLIC